METKLAALESFIVRHQVDINYFYSIHIMSDCISFQGYDNKYPNELGALFTEPRFTNDNWTIYEFEYQSVKFTITLT
jgi:hypothetical protein